MALEQIYQSSLTTPLYGLRMVEMTSLYNIGLSVLLRVPVASPSSWQWQLPSQPARLGEATVRQWSGPSLPLDPPPP
eukprot:CAMPEP_0172850776 /NCGR_PEP_ID=MMETSP1075-20121228/50240_1 /TAXON_ID=2916 /ORGANISM="Ceratium fusus, Strain PA161109" /LENGTH=76 /DNA_ID=CAMNT_0013696685 /DNA_START=18 /DNA_END=245 /DNA_ORIENTATION=-